MEWAPGEVRRAILEAHGVLRGRLDEVEALTARVSGGDGAAAETLRARVLDFQATFLRHIEHEEAVLRPILRHVDGWGDARVDRMDAEHRDQRQALEQLRSMITAGNPAECADALRAFIAAVRADMAQEEREALGEELLKDDPVTTGPLD